MEQIKLIQEGYFSGDDQQQRRMLSELEEEMNWEIWNRIKPFIKQERVEQERDGLGRYTITSSDLSLVLDISSEIKNGYEVLKIGRKL